jgi:hypothetical protein
LPTLRRAIGIACRGSLSGDLPRSLWQVGVAALHVWDDGSWETLSTRHIELARATGDVTELPLALNSRAVIHLFAGELKEAESLVHEAQTVTEATGSSPQPASPSPIERQWRIAPKKTAAGSETRRRYRLRSKQ